MATQVSFDGTSIQTTNIHISEIDHESIDSKDLNIQRLSARDGGRIIDPTIAPKTITLRGTIFGSSQSDLESRIDDFKKLMNKKERNLDIAYLSGTRRYRATVSRVNITRKYFQITHADWEITFVASDPPFGFGIDTQTIEFSATDATIGTFYSSADFQGTTAPMPIIRLTVNSETNLTRINFTNLENNQVISVQQDATFNAGDVLIIDTSDYTVTLNGSAVDYEGVLPEFAQGDNDFKVGFSGTAWNVSLKLIYYPLYL